MEIPPSVETPNLHKIGVFTEGVITLCALGSGITYEAKNSKINNFSTRSETWNTWTSVIESTSFDKELYAYNAANNNGLPNSVFIPSEKTQFITTRKYHEYKFRLVTLNLYDVVKDCFMQQNNVLNRAKKYKILSGKMCLYLSSIMNPVSHLTFKLLKKKLYYHSA